MATLIPQQYYAKNQPVDSTYGPYADLAALGDITNLYQGLTVVVLAPVVMECWLHNGKRKNHWRVKRFTSIPTYADLQQYSATIFAAMNYLIDVGTEATVLADETNEGKVTKYWVTGKENGQIIWEKFSGAGGATITVDGDDQETNE